MITEQQQKCLNELISDDPYIRYASVRRVVQLAGSIGPENTLRKLLPLLQSMNAYL